MYIGATPKLQSVTESGIGTRNVAYDNAGNETALGMAGLGYSARNYLDNSEGFRYFYDGRGVRMITVLTSGAMAFAGDTRRFHFYSPELNLLSETFQVSGSGTPLIHSEYVWFAGQPVGQKEYGFKDTLSWTFTDHLGTPFIQTDSGASISWRAEYEPYGRIFALRTPNHHQSLRLPGQEVQETNTLSTDGNGSSEQFYNVFRWYRFRWGRYSQWDPVLRDPSVGRFVSPDVTPQWSWPTPFGYVDGSPATYIDPLGLMKAKPGIALPTGDLLINLRCLEECLGPDLELRITETTGGHARGTPHSRGVAADFTVIPRDPFLDPAPPLNAPVPGKDVICCARACSFNFSQLETPATHPRATGIHAHVQIPPGSSGVPKPTLKLCCP